MTTFTDRHNWLLENGVCTRQAFAGDIVGAPCGEWFTPGKPGSYPGCGHPNVLHIGRDCCLTCEMNVVLGELRREGTEHQT